MSVAESVRRLFGSKDAHRSSDVFVSFRSGDVDTVRPIVETLLANDQNAWFSEYSIEFAGRARFNELIDDGIRDARFGVCFLSNGYFRSAHCRYEFERLTDTRVHPSDRILCIELERTG